MEPAEHPDVVIEADPAVWLRGPAQDSDDPGNAEWVSSAMYAIATDFDLENAKGGADYREYVHQVLIVFSRWRPEAAAATFLRFRFLGDAPVPIALELYDAAEVAEISAAHEVDFAESNLQAEAESTAGEPSREPVDGTGWERLVYWVVEDGGQVASRVRYVRTYPTSSVVIIVRFSGGDPGRTIEVLADVDDLVRATTVGGEA